MHTDKHRFKPASLLLITVLLLCGFVIYIIAVWYDTRDATYLLAIMEDGPGKYEVVDIVLPNGILLSEKAVGTTVIDQINQSSRHFPRPNASDHWKSTTSSQTVTFILSNGIDHKVIVYFNSKPYIAFDLQMSDWGYEVYPIMLKFPRDISDKFERYVFLEDENLGDNTNNF